MAPATVWDTASAARALLRLTAIGAQNRPAGHYHAELHKAVVAVVVVVVVVVVYRVGTRAVVATISN